MAGGLSRCTGALRRAAGHRAAAAPTLFPGGAPRPALLEGRARCIGGPAGSCRGLAAAAGGGEGIARAQMVDVSAKAPTSRRARAACTVQVGAAVAKALAEGSVEKGDVLTVSEVAGIMAAKRTPDLLPLCHPLPLSRASVRCRLDLPNNAVQVEADISCTGPTGVEMESLTAAAAAALCIYDMCKPINKGIVISDLRLLSKSGGKSGDYVAE
uniref:Molybdopterin cofactor biosynthesis C (MoaC) domain-containing protein n=1 Tax=Alexandrium catenella TaxID=2925 RepID=A0A7S1W1L7_ALECA